MKYMGSKRTMLDNGLGDILLQNLKGKARFVDLFTGSGSVAWFVAAQCSVPVIGADIQRYACTLAGAVILRNESFDHEEVWTDWSARARESFDRCPWSERAVEFDQLDWLVSPEASVSLSREICSDSTVSTICAAYGGHYYSPLQILWIDSFRKSLPYEEPLRTVALASLLTAASECAAAPGHTAQPFQPTSSAAKFLFEYWRRDVETRVQKTLQSFSLRYAKIVGETVVADAERVAMDLGHEDLVFVDPPYSGVQYSRFYHVLEGIVSGGVNEATGVGRYPSPADRPQSEYSLKSKSYEALSRLLTTLSGLGTTVVLTFPQETTSNGLSGDAVEILASNFFQTSRHTINGRFSTLGGNTRNRSARIPAYELVLTLRPK